MSSQITGWKRIVGQEKTDVVYPVMLKNKEYGARLYQVDVTGYEGRTNKL